MIARWLAVAAILAGLQPATETHAASIWTALHPFGGAGTCSVAISPNFATDGTIWAGTYGYGVYVSRDRGSSWTSVDVPGVGVGSCPIALSPQYSSDHTIFLTTDEPYVSHDDGANWTQLDMDPLPAAYAFSPDFDTDGTILAASDTGPVLRSTDGGVTWTQVADWQDGLPADGHFTVDQLTLAADGRAILATDDGIFRSSDSGATWSAANRGLPIIHTVDPQTGHTFARIPAAAGVILSALASGADVALLDTHTTAHLYMSQAGGAWIATGETLNAEASTLLAEESSQGEQLVAGSINGGVFTTDDLGQTWQSLNNGLTDDDVESLALSSPSAGTLVVGAGWDGVFTRAANATQWSTGYAGMPQTDPTLAILPIPGQGSGGLIAGNISGAFRSVDGGQQWRPFDAGLPGERTITALARAGNTVFSSTTEGVYQSPVNANRWRLVGSYLMRGIVARTVATQMSSSGTVPGVAAGTENGLFTSPDGSHHWHMVVKGIMNVEALAFSPAHPHVLYVLNTGQLFEFAGATHERVADVQSNLPLEAFVLSPINGQPTLIATAATLYRRNGNTWTATVQLDGYDRPILEYDGRSRVLVGDGDALLTSTDERHWTRYTTPGHFPIAALAPLPSGQVMVSLAGSGVWRFGG